MCVEQTWWVSCFLDPEILPLLNETINYFIHFSPLSHKGASFGCPSNICLIQFPTPNTLQSLITFSSPLSLPFASHWTLHHNSYLFFFSNACLSSLSMALALALALAPVFHLPFLSFLPQSTGTDASVLEDSLGWINWCTQQLGSNRRNSLQMVWRCL